jgi:hypothetical protein
MSPITGVVTNGGVVPTSPLPEGAHVEIRLQPARPEGELGSATHLTPGELRRMPREQRQGILAAAAEMAEQDYRSDKELTGFSG